MKDVAVVIPAFNEAAALPGVLKDLWTADKSYLVVVVDDGSHDDTYRVAKNKGHGAHVLHHAVNLGQGAALQTAISYTLSHESIRFVVTFDSDGQHHSGDIPHLLAPLLGGDYDVALGTRFATAESVALIPPARRRLLRMATIYTRLTTGLDLTDAHNGLRALSRSAASNLRLQNNGMAHASEILMAIRRLGLSYVEVPVTISYTDYSRQKGQHAGSALNIVWDQIVGRMK